jgi:hypothetical protein
VRRLLKKGRITPEKLPPAEDFKKLQRRVASKAKKLPSQRPLLEATTKSARRSESPVETGRR